jgi:hypothetical protein
MNSKILGIAAAALVLSIPVAQAQVVPSSPEARAQEAAKKGPDQLRRFIHRTRMIYGLNFNNFYKAE